MADVETPNPPDHLDFGLLHDLLGHLLRHAFNRGQAVFAEVFRGQDITPLQFMMVELIARNEGVTHRQLCRSMGTAASVVTTSLKPLIAAKRLAAQPLASDRRMVSYRLTPLGTRWFETLRPRIRTCEDRFAEALTRQQRSELATMLRLISDLPPGPGSESATNTS